MEEALETGQEPVVFPLVFAGFKHLAAGMSTRHGGVSLPPYASLNLDNRGPDDLELRDENRRRFCAALGCSADQMVRALQTHSDHILAAQNPGLFDDFDAMVTNTPGLLLAVSVADCTPVLIYDHRNRAIGAVHAGWKGTVAQLVRKTLEHMQVLYGTQGADCHAWIGPCIDICHFEVGNEVAAQFSDIHKTWDAARGKYMVDLKKANAAQLHQFGIPANQIGISCYSTITHNAQFFSYRQEHGVTGRMLAAIGLREEG